MPESIVAGGEPITVGAGRAALSVSTFMQGFTAFRVEPIDGNSGWTIGQSRASRHQSASLPPRRSGADPPVGARLAALSRLMRLWVALRVLVVRTLALVAAVGCCARTLALITNISCSDYHHDCVNDSYDERAGLTLP